jgi:hypothetical protein
MLNMQIIKRYLRKEIIVIPEEEMDAIDWSQVKQGCIYLDIRGKIFLEINNRGYYPRLYNPMTWDIFFSRKRYYEKLPYRILRECRSRPIEDLIGARQFIFQRNAQMLIPSNVGILPWEFMKGRGYLERNPHIGDIRRGAFQVLFDVLDRVALSLGAKIAYFPVANIDDEKMRKYGCFPIETKGWRARIFNMVLTFPIMNIRVYVKSYGNK